MYPRYEQYQDSGVAWLGNVPSHWEVKRLKFMLAEKLKYGANEPAELSDFSQPRYIRITDIDEQGNLKEDTFKSLEMEKAQDYLLQQNDILLARSGATVGKSYIYKENLPNLACYAGYLIRTRLDQLKLNAFFANYFFQSVCYWDWIQSVNIQATIQNVSAEKYNELYFTVPPLPEQTAIAAFLDCKLAQIDALISKQETLLAKLAEKRTALITHAVTRGLNPAAPLKPSGVVWLGKVPEHWEVMSLKFSLAMPITDGPHETPEILSDGIPFISAEAVKNDKLDFNKKRGYISEEDHLRFCKKYSPQKGDIYMVKSGATTGNVAKVETDKVFNIWSPLAVMRPDTNKISTEFLFYAIKAEYFNVSVQLKWNMGTQQNIGMGVLSNIKVIIPPLPEQTAITHYLDTQTAQIDALSDKIRQTIARLQEYRRTLITQAVTGKIKVIGEHR